ncbi:flagellar hook-basal body complex protein FliE [Legionella fairfieldensis]|uniref:flagellar hook-basal body complex protein FliE n=1 Tax=Legionella fairfieldensis TaxID=45064 RepID=UPI000490B7B2|nr:flagellar hook-basal body complex protein FliE [Legionella fairfieldensis]
MKIDALNTTNVSTAFKSIEQSEKPQQNFAGWLTGKLGETNEQLLAADKALHQLATNQAPNLHQTMLTLEQAKLSFQFLEQIRNRLMSAYQEILREQI